MSAFHQQQFLEVIDRDEAERRFHSVLDLSPLEAEEILLDQALGRVLAEDVIAALDVPSFDRSNVDGFAVRAEDTFGASEDSPRWLTLNSEAIATGVVPRETVQAGSATAVATGAILPRGADAVVMIEYTDVREGRLQLSRPVSPGANVTFAGTDVGMGEIVIRAGERLTARETGVLAALGIARVLVVRQPRVAILSTGDELLTPGEPMRPGMVHDSNATVLADTVRELGGVPVCLGIVRDDDAALDSALQSALESDVILLSGGTSKGAGDLSYRAVARLGKPGIVAHGVALKPGKPLCLAVVERADRRPLPIAVLPGFPTSAIFTFHEFLAPIVRKLGGRREEERAIVRARLPLRVNSERGRTEYLLVGLVQSPSSSFEDFSSLQSGKSDPPFVAYPMGKGSGSVTTFSRADGFAIIPRQQEYLEQGSILDVHLLSRDLLVADLVVIGSHCVGLDYLLGQLHRRGIVSKVLAVGSTAGLDAARRGECDLAGIHLLDPTTDRYNEPFLTPDLVLIRGYVRRQGIVFRRGDERFENRDPVEILRRMVDNPECILINRNRGSGTRILIDRLLGTAKPSGFLTEAKSHNAVAAAIAQGRADWGVAIEPAASNLGLGFLMLRDEHYDFVVPRTRRDRPSVRAFVALLDEPAIRQALQERGLVRE